MFDNCSYHCFREAHLNVNYWDGHKFELLCHTLLESVTKITEMKGKHETKVIVGKWVGGADRKKCLSGSQIVISLTASNMMPN